MDTAALGWPHFPHGALVNVFDARRVDHVTSVRQLAASFPAHTWISHGSAAVVHELPLYRDPAKIGVTRTRGAGIVTSDVHVRCAGLLSSEVTVVDSIPVTSLARTVVDLARSLPFLEALVVVDAALRRGVTRGQLGAVLRHQWNWPRVRHAAVAVHYGDARSESVLESFVRGRIIQLHLPIPQLQMNVFGEHGWVARSDFGWEQFRTVGEADGRIKYLDDELWAEKTRQEDIEDADYEVIRWTWRRAHDPDQEFRRRLLRKFDRGLRLVRLRSA